MEIADTSKKDNSRKSRSPRGSGSLKSLVTWLGQCDAAVADRVNELFAYVSNRSPSMFIAYQIHMPLNRYDDFMCFDRNRVVLMDGGQSYIHANEVQLPKVDYVLTQAPLAHTIIDFWRLVWQVKPQVIVALSEPINASERFFSTGENDVHRCGPLYSIRGTIQPAHTNEAWKTVEETLSVKNTRPIKIRYVMYQNWKVDKTLPPVDEFLSFVREVKSQANEMHAATYGVKVEKLKKRAPIVAVCPTGAVRSGLVAAADAVIRAIETKSSDINIRSIVRSLRDSRYGAIVNFQQYVFLNYLAAETARQLRVMGAEPAVRRIKRIYDRSQNRNRSQSASTRSE